MVTVGECPCVLTKINASLSNQSPERPGLGTIPLVTNDDDVTKISNIVNDSNFQSILDQSLDIFCLMTTVTPRTFDLRLDRCLS